MNCIWEIPEKQLDFQCPTSGFSRDNREQRSLCGSERFGLMLEDEWLKIGFKAGSGDALRRIYEKYRDPLLTLAMALLNDRHAAEDVLHDVFVTFSQSANGFGLRGSLKSYLTVCVANRARDRLRAGKRRAAGMGQAPPTESDPPRPDQRILSDERSQHVADALAKVPDEQREVIALHLNGQMTFKHIARVRNLPLSTVRGRYRHGIEKLRLALNGRL